LPSGFCVVLYLPPAIAGVTEWLCTVSGISTHVPSPEYNTLPNSTVKLPALLLAARGAAATVVLAVDVLALRAVVGVGQAAPSNPIRMLSSSPARIRSGLVKELAWTLNLPPGWILLTARGVDELPGTWWDGWDLFGFFFVLIISLAIAKLTRLIYGFVGFYQTF